MTELTQLAREYLAEAEKLKRRIADLRERLNKAGCAESCEINRRIAILYTMYLECRHTGQILSVHPVTLREQEEDAHGRTAEL